MSLQVQDLPLIFMTLRARQEWICSILEIVLEDSILTQHSRWLRILEAPRRRVKSSWNLRRWIMNQKNIFLVNNIILVLSNLQRGQELKRYRIIWGLYWMFEAVWQNGKWHNDVGRIGAYSVISWWASSTISTTEPLYYKYPLLFMWNCQK